MGTAICGRKGTLLMTIIQKGEPMNDLISRQAAIDAIEKESQVDGAYGYMDTKSIVDLLNNLPSAQPEIIRCKDCKHFAGEGMYCSCDIIVQFDHFYCYHAERRQDV
jgi:hypothetical protein